jgi:hypothetical protein
VGTPGDGLSWNRPEPTPAQQQTATAVIDPVLRERASRAHYKLERITVEAARALGHDPKYTALIDIYFGPDAQRVLCEDLHPREPAQPGAARRRSVV